MRGLLPALKQAFTLSQDQLVTDFWQLQLISTREGNYVYRCQSINPRQCDLSAKILPRDGEEGAWHEYAAMRSLWYHNIRNISPEPLFLIEQNPDFQHDLIISEWIDGEAFPRHKFNKILWMSVLHTLAEVHKITPDFTRVQIPSASYRVENPDDLIMRLVDAIEGLPSPASSTPISHHFYLIGRLMDYVQNNMPRQWSHSVPITLTHGDCTIENVIYEDGTIRLIDWENSGWSDPAMDLASLISHPSTLYLSEDEREWLIEQYCKIMGYSKLNQRIHLYSQVLDALWFVDHIRQVLTDKPFFEKMDAIGQTIEHYARRIEDRYKWHYS